MSVRNSNTGSENRVLFSNTVLEFVIENRTLQGSLRKTCTVFEHRSGLGCAKFDHLTPVSYTHLLFVFSLLGSVINIPVSKHKIIVEEKPEMIFSFLFYYPPRVRHQVIAVNVGGAVIPTVFALYLLGSCLLYTSRCV